MKEKEVLILSSIQWNFLWQRHQSLASFLVERGWKTVFVESTGIKNPSFKDLFRIIFKRYGKITKTNEKNPIPQGLTIINPVILPPTFKIFRAINKWLFIPMLVKRIKKSGLKRPIIIAYPPTETTLRIIDLIPHPLLVYECVDNYEGFPKVPQDIGKTEKELGEKSDIITASSNFLYKKMKNLFPEKTFFVPNGVNYHIFSRVKHEESEKFEAGCYYGSIDQRLDFEALNSVANSLPQIKILLIGPLRTSLPPLKENIIFHPQVPHHLLPEVLSNCDFLLIPYLKNSWVKGVFPAKFFECLATGKPLIVSGIEENIEQYIDLDLVYVAKTPREFAEIVQKLPSLESRGKIEARRKIAKENSWEKRFSFILKLVEEKLREKEGRL